MQVKKSLCVLVQHGVCVFSSGRRGPGSPTEYRTSCDRILRILRFPRYIYTAKTLYGDTGELIVEELLQRGELRMSSTVKTVADRLTQNMEGQFLCIHQHQATKWKHNMDNLCTFFRWPQHGLQRGVVRFLQTGGDPFCAALPSSGSCRKNRQLFG